MNYLPPRFLFRCHEIFRRIVPAESFIEIGAGNLSLSRELLRRFEYGLAVDLTDDLQDSHSGLPTHLRKRLRVLNADFMNSSVPGAFDCLVACEVMEHIDDDIGFLRRVRDVLKPGGQAVLSVPAREKYWSIHDELVGHLRRYEKANLIAKAREAGFEQVSVISYGYPWLNLLRVPRIWLARTSLSGRKAWDREQQTVMSNHRQIPKWLAMSGMPLLVNRYTVFPFALASRMFNHNELSDGYLVTMRRAERGA